MRESSTKNNTKIFSHRIRINKMTKRDKTLIGFLKDNCCNYDRHYQSCLFADSCRVLDGKRCGYFEKAVLGPTDYKYKIPGYDYAKLFAQYAEQTGAQKQRVEVRRCECGEPLLRRQRYCPRCSKIKARKANRERVRKHRLSNNVNVTV